MSFPAYSKYKDSGIPWLGEVPSHWHAAHLRWLARRYSGGTPDKRNIDFWENGTIPWLSSGEVNQRTVLHPTTYITEDALAQSSAKWVPTGALVMALAGQGKTKGMVAQMAIDATCNQSMAAIVPRDEKYARYLFWWLETNYQNIRNMAGGDLRDGLNLELLGDIECPIPASSEQTSIAAFLDRETAKIDALVAEQERLIALLKEKRQAVISQAVTKGLIPNAPMKDSGIEWLGVIPAHWKVIKVLRLFRASKGKEGQLLTKEYCAENAGEFPVYSGQTENDGVMGTLNRYEFDAGDMGYLFSTTVGAKAMTVGHIFGKFSLSQNCMIIRPVDASADSRFFYYHFQPVFAYHRSLIPDHMQPSFRMEDLYGFAVALPPKGEQLEIARYLDEALTGYRALENEAQSAINLLQERRAALISAAVTGKIDVRGLVEASTELELA